MEYKKGKIAGIHLVGTIVAKNDLATQEEEKTSEIVYNTQLSIRDAIIACANATVNELKKTLTVGELRLVTNVANNFINTCEKICDNSRINLTLTKGAATITKKILDDVKALYDDENNKLIAEEHWINTENKSLKDRPIGVNPGNPVKDLRNKK